MEKQSGTQHAIRIGATIAIAAVVATLTACAPGSAGPGTVLRAAAPGHQVAAAHSAQAGALARAARAIAQTAGYDGQRFPAVFIVDHTCAYNRLERSPARCKPKPIPADVRTALAKALADLGPVTYIRDGRDVVDAQRRPPVRDSGVVIYFGDVKITGRSAKIHAVGYVDVLGAAGTTYLLRRSDDGWRIIREVGTSWIS